MTLFVLSAGATGAGVVASDRLGPTVGVADRGAHTRRRHSASQGGVVDGALGGRSDEIVVEKVDRRARGRPHFAQPRIAERRQRRSEQSFTQWVQQHDVIGAHLAHPPDRVAELRICCAQPGCGGPVVRRRDVRAEQQGRSRRGGGAKERRAAGLASAAGGSNSHRPRIRRSSLERPAAERKLTWRECAKPGPASEPA